VAHIPDGVLGAPVLIGGAVMAAAGCGIGLRQMTPERIPQVALLSGVFFVASLVHFPVGPSSVHLLFSGLIGVVLGWAAFPAILTALLLQAVLFGFGGLVVLGVNVVDMALPAILCRALFLGLCRLSPRPGTAILAAAVASGVGVLLTALLVAVALSLSGREFVPAARLVVFVHLPVAAIETVVGAAMAALLIRVRPEFLGLPPLPAAPIAPETSHA
jgi:cobalt/nickel transport system permease protein